MLPFFQIKYMKKKKHVTKRASRIFKISRVLRNENLRVNCQTCVATTAEMYGGIVNGRNYCTKSVNVLIRVFPKNKNYGARCANTTKNRYFDKSTGCWRYTKQSCGVNITIWNSVRTRSHVDAAPGTIICAVCSIL